MLTMTPRAPLTGSFSVNEENNVVVCPLRNHDASACRKRCTGEKRYRSMQEHIRRAHPEHYISKLPATEESFTLMVNTPPQERRPPPPIPSSSAGPQVYAPNDFSAFVEADYGSSAPAATAAAALASLHNYRAELDWESEPDAPSDHDSKSYRPRARFAPTTHEQQFAPEEPYYTATSIQRELLPSSLAHSPPGRSSTLPPAPRSIRPNRPRKSSVGQSARRGKHERQKSKDHSRRLSYDRKAFSAEPQTAAAIMGKRWEDLIDAAASATEEDSRDLTPVPQSPYHSPHTSNRRSLPPFAAPHFQSYTASPLQRNLTPPPPDMSDLQPFPSVESSIESAVSGHGFHMPSQGLSDSSPTYPYPVQIYCAACRKLSVLRDSYACSECICGLCQECVDVLVSEHTRGRATRCPRCNAVGGKFKPFQLDIR
ncbi:hypothetical protein HBI04_189650 [Parastagonospora nodorum]|nr:hypothetical protein HBH51_179500 [Parastagonospora nodorum]KAH4065158.1 hypothetical protein HBH50_162790 [Parastagonospora nodorum]KAH4084557.1 hypothetical protein HBH48_160520 [Parastagonospora nodorum]KAH4259882.1 hypothetical protein HBI03_132510 [Parastagonospora nodorum]KAH4263944.1 hypothetical protein HBI04_189650 [Parastagonospora nodorum]